MANQYVIVKDGEILSSPSLWNRKLISQELLKCGCNVSLPETEQEITFTKGMKLANIGPEPKYCHRKSYLTPTIDGFIITPRDPVVVKAELDKHKAQRITEITTQAKHKKERLVNNIIILDCLMILASKSKNTGILDELMKELTIISRWITDETNRINAVTDWEQLKDG